MPIYDEDENDLSIALEAARPRRLQRALELIILLIVAGTALVHPICLQEDALREVSARIDWRGFFQQLLPWINCGYSPLVLKECLLLTLALPLLFFFAWIKVRGQLLGLEKSAFAGNAGWRGLARSPEAWAIAWLAYAAASVFWSPTFNNGLQTWVLMAAGIATGLIARSQLLGRRAMVHFMGLVVACGVALAGVALMQHLGKIEWLPQSADPRNRMSSLIGHNTGLSSWLMFPLSYAIYFGLVNRRWWVRAIMWAVAALIVLVIIAAESRAIWVLGLLIVLWLPFKIMRLLGTRLPVGKLLIGAAVAAALVMALMVSPRTNPLARLPVSLGERLSGHVFNLDQLRRETRLRILVVSMAELFPKAPVFGGGLGSFAWEYPKAQGEYFTAHPDSRLGTTTRRTDLAHNDYLQALVETGLVGLALALGAMWALALQSGRCYRRLALPENRAAWWALALPSLAVAVHALVDFPLHVAPIALVALVSAMLSTRVEMDGASAVLSGAILKPDWRQVRRASWISLPVAVILLAWTPWAWQAFVGRVLASDAYFNSGAKWLQRFYESTGQTPQHNFLLLERARSAFRQAVVTNVFNGEAYEGQATAYVNRAAVALQQLQFHADDVTTTQSIGLRSLIKRDSEAAITTIYNQLASGGLRYHFTWYLLGRAWRMQWELERADGVPPQRSKAYKEAVAAQRKAIAYNPADATALRELADLLGQSLNTRPESQKVLDRLLTVDPWSARELLIDPALKLAQIGETTTARTMLQPIFSRHPDLPITLAARGWLAYFTAVWPPAALDDIDRKDEYLAWRKQHLAAAIDAVAALPSTKDFENEKQRLQMLYAAASGDLNSAHAISKARVEKNQFDREALAIFYWTDRELFGGALKLQDSVEYYRTQALLAIYFMDRRSEGLALGELSMRETEELTLPEARRYAAFCMANGWWDFFRKTLPSILETYPADPMLNEAAQRAAAELAAAQKQ